MENVIEIPINAFKESVYQKAERKYISYIHELALYNSRFTLHDDEGGKIWNEYKEKTFAEIKSLIDAMSKEEKQSFAKLIIGIER